MQLWAIISDTYRSLQSRGLFWIILCVSVVLGVLFASLGCHADGWSVLFGALKFESSYLRAGTEWEKSLLLNTLHVLLDNWCMIWASFLALFAAATIFPDAMQPGAIDLLLSKPIGRGKLFLGKYLAALGFVAVQTTVLVTICFLSLWWRLHTAYWGIFWSIGLAVLIFSFVYCVTTLVGILTRSSMAALLWSVLFWFLLWAVQKGEFETGRKIFALTAESLPNEELKKFSGRVQQFHDLATRVMTVLPRTRQTGELFSHVIKADAPYTFTQIFGQSLAPANSIKGMNLGPEAPVRSIHETIRSGVLFQFVVLLLAFWRFRTLDF
jgi:hypothetical protein